MRDDRLRDLLNSQLGSGTRTQQDARRLLLEVLRVNPEDRLTIQEVADHPFLGRNLPTLWGIQDAVQVSVAGHYHNVLVPRLHSMSAYAQVVCMSCVCSHKSAARTSKQPRVWVLIKFALPLQRIDGKVDTLLTAVKEVQDRMYTLEQLPEQLRAGFTRISGEISGVRRMVLAVSGMCCDTCIMTQCCVQYQCAGSRCHPDNMTNMARMPTTANPWQPWNHDLPCVECAKLLDTTCSFSKYLNAW
jgi:hypothetical protein